MTHFLVTDENPDGYKLEDILSIIRKDIIKRAVRIMDDERPEAQHVMANNVEILGLLTQAIDLAKDSTVTLQKSFGPAGDTPRIGS